MATVDDQQRTDFEATLARAAEEHRAEAGEAIRRASLWRDALHRFTRNRASVVALVFFVVLVGYVYVAPLFSPWDPYEIDFKHMYANPSWAHLFGTDDFGRDMFVRAALGGRVSIQIGFAATFAIMGFLDALYGLPYLPFAILTLVIFGTVNFWTMVVGLTVASWFTTGRVMRGQIISLKENDYVRAAHAAGARWYRILFRHLLPNTLGVIIVFVFLELPGVVLGEAFLSFIALGSNPPKASWGAMAQEGYTAYRDHPHIIIVPSLLIAWLILTAFFVADGLRDALDPRTKEGH